MGLQAPSSYVEILDHAREKHILVTRELLEHKLVKARKAFRVHFFSQLPFLLELPFLELYCRIRFHCSYLTKTTRDNAELLKQLQEQLLQIAAEWGMPENEGT